MISEFMSTPNLKNKAVALTAMVRYFDEITSGGLHVKHAGAT
jgi:hypothetical protein